jgi:hypothetical protein
MGLGEDRGLRTLDCGRRAILTDQESHDRTTLWRARHASPTRGAFMSVVTTIDVYDRAWRR